MTFGEILPAWKLFRRLNFNAKMQYMRMHIFNALIISFTFFSVLLGTITYELKETESPRLFGVPIPAHVISVLRLINIGIPMITSLFIALNSAFSPSSKYRALYHTSLFVQSEIYKASSLSYPPASTHSFPFLSPQRRFGNFKFYHISLSDLYLFVFSSPMRMCAHMCMNVWVYVCACVTG